MPKPKVAFYWCASCGGCEETVVDLAEDILAYIPKERAKDVIYFDAGDEERPMGLNLYEINILDEADRVVNDATEIFLKMFGPEIFGPRLQEYFKY